MADKQNTHKWYHQANWALLIGVVAIAAAYGVGSRSLDTGSWQQYFMTLGLLILGVNRLSHAVKLGVRKMYSHRKAA